MPIVEYTGQDGTRFERLYLAGDGVPPDVLEDEEHGLSYRTVSAPVVHFVGPFSGGTSPANGMKDTRELARPDEVKTHARRRREEKKEKTRKKVLDTVAKASRDFDF